MTKNTGDKHSPVRQPLDRHLSEIVQATSSATYINAGIDSTCCKKQTATIHRLNADGNGVVDSSLSSSTTDRTETNQ